MVLTNTSFHHTRRLNGTSRENGTNTLRRPCGMVTRVKSERRGCLQRRGVPSSFSATRTTYLTHFGLPIIGNAGQKGRCINGMYTRIRSRYRCHNQRVQQITQIRVVTRRSIRAFNRSKRHMMTRRRLGSRQRTLSGHVSSSSRLLRCKSTCRGGNTTNSNRRRHRGRQPWNGYSDDKRYTRRSQGVLPRRFMVRDRDLAPSHGTNDTLRPS